MFGPESKISVERGVRDAGIGGDEFESEVFKR